LYTTEITKQDIHTPNVITKQDIHTPNVVYQPLEKQNFTSRKEVEWQTFFLLGIPLQYTKEAKIHFSCLCNHSSEPIHNPFKNNNLSHACNYLKDPYQYRREAIK
jgi:hypothetical protein